jgi:small-conductance mechanosensitive channel/CRP-like cAMP-binding protein
VADYSIWIAAGLVVIAAILWKPLERERNRVRSAFGLLFLWAAATIFATASAHWAPEARVAREVARTLLIMATIQTGSLLLFEIGLRKVRLPKFASEIAVVAAYAVALFQLLNRLGVDATGIFATSAVLTAIIGLALQDMLSNLAGGMALQLEDNIDAGDYIRCGEYAGWVQHVRLRHTQILTSDGDSVVVPNSFLTRAPVVVVSKASRRFLPFNMPYTHDPQDVMGAVETALRSSPIVGVAGDPQPRCLVQELTAGHIRYAAVVWFTDPGHDSDRISTVLNRVFYGLQRAGIPTGEISFLVETKSVAPPQEEASPSDVLHRTPIFRLLDEVELTELAAAMRHMTFAPGERLLRQGDPGDSMYFVVAGRIGITIQSSDGSEKELASFEAGDFFGEISLLTGEPRGVTASALSRVTCYCLDKTGLQRTMERQPDLAEDMSVILAHRQIELSNARETMDREGAIRRESENQIQILARIRRFFGIGNTSATA